MRRMLFVLPALLAMAADWPQFLGPDRSGISTETGLATSWPREGPPVVWKKDIGEGFSGPVVAGDTLILLHRVDNSEVVEAFDAGTGQGRWRFAYDVTYRDNYGKGNGPRSTPLIVGGRVYTFGVEGHLHCLDLATGKKIWGRKLGEDYALRETFFGIGTSPLLEGDRLLINVGADKAGIVAFNKDDGKEVWKATSDEASYASPVAATIDGVRQVLFFTRQGLVSLDPANGAVRFTHRWRSRQHASVNAATPVVIGDQVFLSASYGTGAGLFKVRKDGVSEVWSGDGILSNHYGTSIHKDGFLYGFDGRQEEGARLRCIELKTGKVRWTQDGYNCGSIILVDGNLIVLTENGQLSLVEATPEGYREKARATVLGRECRAQIALADGRLYGRDRNRLVCWNVKK